MIWVADCMKFNPSARQASAWPSGTVLMPDRSDSHTKPPYTAQTGDGKPEEVGGERVGEAELQLRVGTQHHETP